MLDPRIILQGRSPSAIAGQVQRNSLMEQQRRASAFEMQQAAEKAFRDKEMRDFFSQRGPDVLAGDRDALGGLARFDPGLAQKAMHQNEAVEMQRRRLGLAEENQRFNQGLASSKLDLARQGQNFNQQLAAGKFDMDSRQKALEAEMANADRVMAMLTTADTPEKWDEIASRVDPDMVGRFDEREELMAAVQGAKATIAQQMPKPPAGYERAEDGTLRAIKGGPADKEVVRELAEARNTGEYERMYGPDGNMVFERGSSASPQSQKLTEMQSRSVLFGEMMKTTAPALKKLEEQFDSSNTFDILADRAGIAGNFFKSEEYQQYSTLAKAWAEGVLRLQTGMAGPDSEIERIVSTYFPRPGDSKSVVDLKIRMRDAFLRSVASSAGGAVDADGQPLADVLPEAKPLPPADEAYDIVAAPLKEKGLKGEELMEAIVKELKAMGYRIE